MEMINVEALHLSLRPAMSVYIFCTFNKREPGFVTEQQDPSHRTQKVSLGWECHTLPALHVTSHQNLGA